MILLKNATIIDATSTLNGKKRDVLIKNGKIEKIASSIENSDAKIIQKDNLHLSIGWMDTSVSLGEPGFEERQTLKNGIKAAAAGGFTTIMLNPNNQPNPQDQSGVMYLKNVTANQAVSILPVGSFTLHQDGEHLAELYDMQKAGAVSFYDYKHEVTNANLLKVGLQYTSSFNSVVQSYPQNKDIAGKGIVNEDLVSTNLGLKSMPSLAEELQIARDLRIAAYTKGRLHIPTVSTTEGLKLIKEYKKSSKNVSCSVSIHHLTLSSNELESFDANFKLQPPLRDDKEVKQLQKFLNSDVIDVVTSDHMPLTIEHKDLEFDRATAGTIGMESAFGALNNLIATDKAVELLTNGYTVFNQDRPQIEEGQIANLTIFEPDTSYTFEKSNIVSTSKNSAFLGKTMKGKVIGIINNKKALWNE
ncbi:dihydroorotase [Nonlabens xylanidelens]|uniref:Dihydroorotase n=1 Tax=Nonlabens xylanidelens TaxID=191564 RepID=A0A2S6IN56_9FLAO|nr:dihydroorotase [Nonlabens xylanidelens]PPK95682.1 dihydroorotase [Nonlabens xylanidelens]PQJ22481.1 dihydroorotase [Nonlabens xylanidelens]